MLNAIALVVSDAHQTGASVLRQSSSAAVDAMHVFHVRIKIKDKISFKYEISTSRSCKHYF